jgi:dienelactone hydrolase
LGDAIGGDLEGTCRALAEEGFLAHSAKRPETVSLEGHLDKVLDALDSLRENPDADKDRIGIMGFSRGGLLTLQAAIERPDNINAIVLFAPAPAKQTLENTLKFVAAIGAPVRVYVAANDLYQADHVQLAKDVEAALRAANKEVELTIYPEFGNDGHELFFELRDSYWLDVLAFLEVL